MAQKDHLLQLRCDAEFVAGIDEWRATRRPIPSRSEAIRRLAMRGVALDVYLDVILRESASELLTAGVVSAATEAEIYARWSQVLIQSLDHAAQGAAPGVAHDQARETPAPDTSASMRQRAIR